MNVRRQRISEDTSTSRPTPRVSEKRDGRLRQRK